jgi:Domain of unknown function (DUF4350)
MSTTTALGRSPAEVWRSARRPLLLVGVLIAIIVVLVLIIGTRTSGPFSPDSTEPAGAQALAVLLENHHVDVTGTEQLADATAPEPGSTLLVAPGGSIGRAGWEAIDRAGWEHVILVRPPGQALDVLAPGVALAGSISLDSRPADCDLDPAVKSGTATVAGMTYSAPAEADSCYGDGVHGSVVRLDNGGRTVDVVGTPVSFTNDHLADDGNAALALNLLGTHARLVWYLPGFETDTIADGNESDEPVIPDWVRYVAWMIAFAALTAALWRGRRLGPVVPEALPVVVHAAETTEGRARLYRRSRARDRAADVLRESALARLRKALGLGRLTGPAAVVSAVAARTGRDPAGLHDLLYGGPPYDDTALLNLSRELDALTQEVRRP